MVLGSGQIVKERRGHVSECGLGAVPACAFVPFLLRLPMPVHAHLGDLAVLGLAEDGAARVYPLARAAPPVGAAEFSREPGSRDVQLPRLEGHVGLVRRDVLPVGADRLDPCALVAERGPRNTASGVKTEAISSRSPRSQPLPNRLTSSRYASDMARNIRQSGTAGPNVWYTER